MVRVGAARQAKVSAVLLGVFGLWLLVFGVVSWAEPLLLIFAMAFGGASLIAGVRGVRAHVVATPDGLRVANMWSTYTVAANEIRGIRAEQKPVGFWIFGFFSNSLPVRSRIAVAIELDGGRSRWPEALRRPKDDPSVAVTLNEIRKVVGVDA